MPPAICTCPGGLNIFFLYKSAASRQQLFSLTHFVHKKSRESMEYLSQHHKNAAVFLP